VHAVVGENFGCASRRHEHNAGTNEPAHLLAITIAPIVLSALAYHSVK
jgi:hypothetical protein